MKRGKKLLALLAVLVLLLGATWAVGKLNPETEEAEEDTSMTVFQVNTSEITELGWDYSENLSFRRTEDGWTYTADETFLLNTSYIDTMLSTLAEIKSYKTIENVENWDQYGLEVPVCTITITTDTTQTLCIGLETSMGGQRYFSIGDGNAYLVDASVIDAFSYGLYDVLKEESVPDITSVTGMRMVSTAGGYEIALQENSGLAYSDSYVWFMDGKPLDTELTEDLIMLMVDLTWTECVNYNASDLSVYGLDEPAATVTVDYIHSYSISTSETDDNGDVIFETVREPASFTIELGDVTGNYRYARIAGSNMVYTIYGTAADTMNYTTYYDLQPDDVLLMDWDTVHTLEITLDGETYEVTRETRTVTDEEDNETEEIVYLLNGEEVSFAAVTDLLDTMESAGYASGQIPDRNAEIQIRILREHDTFPEVELVFYQYDSTKCLTTLNGEATVYVAREDVVELVEAVTKIVLA